MFSILVPNYFGNTILEKKIFMNENCEEFLHRCESTALEVRPPEFESCLTGDPE